MEAPTDSSQSSRGRGRGRGKSRGGLGKYLRARGRGRSTGRPAEFGKRLVLEDEEEVELDPESEEAIQAREFQQKFARRQLGSNADRYAEPDPVFNSDGKEEIEPEVDLSSFLERQRLSEESPGPSAPPPPNEGEVDESLAHISSHPHRPSQSKKGKIQMIDWNEELDAMIREKAAAEATWDLKSRFQAKSDKLRAKPISQTGRGARNPEKVKEAPLLPAELAAQSAKDPKHEMQDFLDDLLG